MTNEVNAQAEKRHVFSHLGAAPYRYLGMEEKWYVACPGAPKQPGSTCDHCGTGIALCFNFRSADGNTFKVGSSCVAKSGDAGLKRVIADDERKLRAEKSAKRARGTTAVIETILADPAERARLESERHPMGFKDRATGQPLTALDYVTWMLANSGNSGRERVSKFLTAKPEECPECGGKFRGLRGGVCTRCAKAEAADYARVEDLHR